MLPILKRLGVDFIVEHPNGLRLGNQADDFAFTRPKIDFLILAKWHSFTDFSGNFQDNALALPVASIRDSHALSHGIALGLKIKKVIISQNSARCIHGSTSPALAASQPRLDGCRAFARLAVSVIISASMN